MSASEALHNGICLPSPWPPERTSLTVEPLATPPYLTSPPSVIPIDVGRQLFVDDFLVEAATLCRTYHMAEYHPTTPVVIPDRPWETGSPSHGHAAPTAMVFSDGVWYDPDDRLFKMWYMGGNFDATCLATSGDGLHWEKPVYDVQPGTNVVSTRRRDSSTVWLDLETTDPQRRYAMVLYDFEGGLSIHFSADGVHWLETPPRSGPCGDRTTVHRDPFRHVWVYGLREFFPDGVGRCRRYWEHADLLQGARWEAGQPTLWVGADRLDPQREDLRTPCQLYNLDCVAYESLTLGLFSVWRGQPDDRAKPNEVCVGFSRDGFHWTRPDRRALVRVSEHEGDWNWGNIQSAGGCCLVIGDKLYFYVSGRSGVPGAGTVSSGTSGTGLAVLRRDGFASMDAGDGGGTLTTRPVTFSGQRLFVNAQVPAGEALRVEILDQDHRPMAPYTHERCVPIHSNGTLLPVRWSDTEGLSPLCGTPVRFRFHLTKGSLYSFWVSPDTSGASHGYVAAGGPGYASHVDTVGETAYAAAEAACPDTVADRIRPVNP